MASHLFLVVSLPKVKLVIENVFHLQCMQEPAKEPPLCLLKVVIPIALSEYTA